MAIRSNDNRDTSGRYIKPTSKPSSKPEPKPQYVDGQIVRDDNHVRSHRVQSRHEFTDAIQSKGGEGKTYPAATNKLYGKIFRNGTPIGKPDQWSAEDQKRVTVGQKIAKQYIDNGDDGHYGVISSVERGGADANARCNEDGVEPWWRKLIGYDLHEQRQQEEKKTVLERRQTDTDQENDSHLTPGQKLMKQHRARQAEESSSGGGFLKACFGGKDLWEERAEQEMIDASNPEDNELPDASSSGGGFLHWLLNP